MIKVVLAGNPNVGKSLIFSRITGIGAISANYSGTTVGTRSGVFIRENVEYELTDAPGVYSLETFSKAEETTRQLIENADCIINVLDATNLERNLGLTIQLCAKKVPMVVCLNFWDETTHKGVKIDTVALEELLGVPVVPTSALHDQGMPALIAALRSATISILAHSDLDPWKRIGTIVETVQKLSHRHHTPLEVLSDITLHPVAGLFSAVAILSATFFLVRLLGETLVNHVCGPLFNGYYFPFINNVISAIPFSFLRDLLVGTTTDPLQSFGILSTGIYIALVLVFPYFFSFYLFFGFLEDFGYLPRLAVVLDTFFHRLGLHGYSSIPVMLGLGCKVPAFMATRVLTSRREKVLTMSLILMSAPCLPQSAMIISLGMKYGTFVVLSIFAILLVVALVMNMFMNKITHGEQGDLMLELPSYRMPTLAQLFNKLRYRIVDYIKEVFPLIAAGVLIMHILDRLKIIQLISDVIGKPITWLLGLPHDIAPVMVLGFLRKDVSIALLAPFHLTAQQFVIASIFMVLYVPCVASFFTLLKELGFSMAVRVMGIVFVTAVVVTSLLHGLFVLISIF